MSEISEAIRYHRKKSGLSQEELAKIAGVGKTVVLDIEKGKQTVQLDTLSRILRVLNISMKLESPLMRDFMDDQKRSRNAKG